MKKVSMALTCTVTSWKKGLETKLELEYEQSNEPMKFLMITNFAYEKSEHGLNMYRQVMEKGTGN